MISDNTLYSLSIFLGSLAMLLIVLYHFLEINAHDDPDPNDSAGLRHEKLGVGVVKQGHARGGSAGGEKSGNGEKSRGGNGSS